MSFLPSTDFNDGDDDFLMLEDDEVYTYGIGEEYFVPVKIDETRSESDQTVMTEISSPSSLSLQQFEDRPSTHDHDSDLPIPRTSSSNMMLPKSALKKNFDVQEIPVCTKGRSWKALPAPCMIQVKGNEMKQTESMSSFFHPAEPSAAALSIAAPSMMKKVCSQVQFRHITIREYEQTLGDNPSVSYGPPISLDWNYTESEATCLDEYEGTRGQRRSLRQMGMNYYQRKGVLTRYGYSEKEMEIAKKEANKAKTQRAMTKQFLPLLKIEDALESAARKAKRAFWKNREKDVNTSPDPSSNTEEGEGTSKKGPRRSRRKRSMSDGVRFMRAPALAHSVSTPALAHSVSTPALSVL
jgi:hypothetical protein